MAGIVIGISFCSVCLYLIQFINFTSVKLYSLNEKIHVDIDINLKDIVIAKVEEHLIYTLPGRRIEI